MIRAVFGTGGFGREVMPLLMRDDIGKSQLLFVEDKPTAAFCNGVRVRSTHEFMQLPVQSTIAIAVANAEDRRQIAKRVLGGICEPDDIIAGNVVSYFPHEIGPGAIICAFTSIHPNVKIGEQFHANIYSYVAHDCEIGDFVTFAPRVNCNGGIKIGDGVYIGTGAVLRDHIEIGAGAVIGMGSVVTKSVPPGAVVYGNPAKIIRMVKVNTWIK